MLMGLNAGGIENDMRESDIEKQIIKFATSRGWWCLKLHIINHAGFPDRLCLALGGQIMFVEFKATGKKPRKLKIWVIEKLRGMGFNVYVIDSIAKGQQIFS